MALDTYSGLKSAAASWLARSDLTASLPDFVTLAEARINRELRIREMLAQATGSIAVQSIALPGDFIEPVLLVLDTATDLPLEFRPPEDAQLRSGGSTSGQPKYFTVLGGQIRLYPTPDTSYDYTLDYYATLDALSDTNASNAILVKAPDLYLFATLCEAEPFLQNDERVALWEARYQNARAVLNGADQRSRRSAGVQRMRVVV